MRVSAERHDYRCRPSPTTGGAARIVVEHRPIVPTLRHRWLHGRSVHLHARAVWTVGPRLGDDVSAVEAKVADLGEQLRNLRIARGLKQTIAAERIGRSEHVR